MGEPSQKAVDAEFLIGRVGVTAVLCAVLIYVLFFKLDKMSDGLHLKLDRTVRNTRAIMQKQGIPVVFDSDMKDSK